MLLQHSVFRDHERYCWSLASAHGLTSPAHLMTTRRFTARTAGAAGSGGIHRALPQESRGKMLIKAPKTASCRSRVWRRVATCRLSKTASRSCQTPLGNLKRTAAESRGPLLPPSLTERRGSSLSRFPATASERMDFRRWFPTRRFIYIECRTVGGGDRRPCSMISL